MTSDSIFAVALRTWAKRREATGGELLDVEIDGATAAGLPVLAALYRLVQRIEAARGPITPGEVLAELRPVISVAVGEGCVRAERRGIADGVPGIPTIPRGEVL